MVTLGMYSCESLNATAWFKKIKKNTERVNICWPTRFGPSLRAGDVCRHVATFCWNHEHKHAIDNCFGKFREEHLVKFAGVLKGLFFGMTFHLNIRNCCICYIAPCDITRTSNDLAWCMGCLHCISKIGGSYDMTFCLKYMTEHVLRFVIVYLIWHQNVVF